MRGRQFAAPRTNRGIRFIGCDYRPACWIEPSVGPDRLRAAQPLLHPRPTSDRLRPWRWRTAGARHWGVPGPLRRARPSACDVRRWPAVPRPRCALRCWLGHPAAVSSSRGLSRRLGRHASASQGSVWFVLAPRRRSRGAGCRCDRVPRVRLPSSRRHEPAATKARAQWHADGMLVWTGATLPGLSLPVARARADSDCRGRRRDRRTRRSL